MALGRRPDRAAFPAAVATRPSGVRSQPALLLELAPSLHRDLRAVELALVLDTRLLRLLARRLARVAPREVVELPECVHRQHEVPDGQRDQVHEHPQHVRPPVRRQHDQYARQTKDQRQEHDWDDLDGFADNGDDN